MDVTTKSAARPVQLGLRENWPQFTLLVIVNICVGGLVGPERTTVPLIGARTFGLTDDLAVFSFIIAFGLTKAHTSLAAGALTARFRRKRLLSRAGSSRRRATACAPSRGSSGWCSSPPDSPSPSSCWTPRSWRASCPPSRSVSAPPWSTRP